VAVAVLVLVTVLIAHALRSSTVTLAVTPKPLAYHMPPLGAPSGRQELLKLAAAAARQPTGPAEHPRYAYAETRGWYLRTKIGGPNGDLGRRTLDQRVVACCQRTSSRPARTS
jgi:hypothetical protein